MFIASSFQAVVAVGLGIAQRNITDLPATHRWFSVLYFLFSFRGPHSLLTLLFLGMFTPVLDAWTPSGQTVPSRIVHPPAAASSPCETHAKRHSLPRLKKSVKHAVTFCSAAASRIATIAVGLHRSSCCCTKIERTATRLPTGPAVKAARDENCRVAASSSVFCTKSMLSTWLSPVVVTAWL